MMCDHADIPASARLEEIKVVTMFFAFIHHQSGSG